jgi:hypothetical protein
MTGYVEFLWVHPTDPVFIQGSPIAGASRVDASFLGNPKSVRRTGEKVFGVIAIVAGAGLVTAVIAGVEVSSVILILVPLVVIGWSIYHYVVVRPAPWA